MFYLRKINRGKWPSENTIPQAKLKDIPADTVVTELKTLDNKLSVWKIENDEDLVDAFIALASNSDYLVSIDAIKIDSEKMKNLEFDLEIGDTPAKKINEKHRNIINLNYINLGSVIEAIIDGFQNKHNIRKTKSEIKDILKKACADGKVKLEDLSPDIQKHLKK